LFSPTFAMNYATELGLLIHVRIVSPATLHSQLVFKFLLLTLIALKVGRYVVELQKPTHLHFCSSFATEEIFEVLSLAFQCNGITKVYTSVVLRLRKILIL